MDSPWRKRAMRIAVASVVALVAAAGIAWFQVQSDPRSAVVAGPAGTALPVASAPQDIGGPFTLTDHTGQRVSDADFRGRHMLVYFGFTFCPDVCPTELSTMVRALEALGPAGESVVPLLITIDPARDTPDALASYVALFDERLIGLTGTDEEIAAVADAYRVFYARAPDTGQTTTYLMDHSAYIYLMAPTGENLVVFPQGVGPERMAEALAVHVGGPPEGAPAGT